MELKELLDGIGGTRGLAAIILAALTIVQVTPVKINPWTSLAKAIGKALNADLYDTIQEQEATNARYRIIRFDDEIRHHTLHTEEHFNQIISDIDKYEKYCKKHPNYENSKAAMAIDNVKRAYSKCRLNNSFFI